jgi:hypothetical protein
MLATLDARDAAVVVVDALPKLSQRKSGLGAQLTQSQAEDLAYRVVVRTHRGIPPPVTLTQPQFIVYASQQIDVAVAMLARHQGGLGGWLLLLPPATAVHGRRSLSPHS